MRRQRFQLRRLGTRIALSLVASLVISIAVVPTSAFASSSFRVAPAPTVVGSARVGSVITATSAKWAPKPTLQYQWLRNGAKIKSATKTKYRVTLADIGQRLSVKVTAKRSGYHSKSRLSKITAAVVSDHLAAGDILRNGRVLTSPDGRYTLAMQGDGNLVEYFQGRSVWDTHTAGVSNTYLAMQKDGNLVLYSGAKALWNSETSGTGAKQFNLQNDGNLVVYSPGIARWSSGTNIDTLLAGQSLETGEFLMSADRAYTFVVQGDGNAVVYGPGGTARWSSNTHGTVNPEFYLQGDGQVVLYGTPGVAAWNAGTAGLGGVQLVMQSDGNLVLYDARHTAVWSTAGGISNPPLTSIHTKAVAWALSQVGSPAYPGICEVFVENAYGTRYKYASAIVAFRSLQSAGTMHYTTSNIPAGALVFSSYAAWDNGNGHVELSVGNGTFVSGGASTGTASTVAVYSTLPKGYLGWAMPPASWPGR